ncbi:hypothetical protein OESDEN_20124 [Oesophagostomum dentatum]|uniref:Ubiquitin-like protease family profile domain-containing protein n=1 Tax=Oesophagostomum dentatum TaxID=61180 RepID=A0A0B1SAI0_OESDE|nr:hypothetical protein OESDEN_20124 [Oesophagostomum dentatum]
MYKLIGVERDDDDIEEVVFESSSRPNGGESLRNRNSPSRSRFTFPETPAVIDLSRESTEKDDQDVEIVAEVQNVAPPFTMEQPHEVVIRRETIDLTDSDENEKSDDVVYVETRPSSSAIERQEEDNGDVEFVKAVERQDEGDDVTIVAEVCNSPRDVLLDKRKSVETARDRVTSLSSLSVATSPARSNSSVSIVMDSGRPQGDQESLSSPAPEDSVSRQGTPRFHKFETPSPRSDPWRRRRSAGITKTKSVGASAHATSIERTIARLRSESCGGMPGGSNVNLAARDYLVDMISKMGNLVEYPSRNGAALDVSVDKRKPFRKSRRVEDALDARLRVRKVLDKLEKQKSERRKQGGEDEEGSLNKSFERQSSSEQPSENGDSVQSIASSNEAEEAEIVTESERQSSRSQTPMSSQSTGVERLAELLSKMNTITQRPTPHTIYERFKDELREKTVRQNALKEEIRLRNLAGLYRREIAEEDIRKNLELVGIRVPARKPKVKDEFPPLPEEAHDLCQRVWNRRSSQSEEFSEGFGIKLTRKDLSTLSGLDWLNDEVINFYLQLVCERSTKAKDLPKTYAFNTFFYANISTKGYASVKRWTRKVDIFAHDVLLVPVHLSVHWCMAVIDLERKRIDYYDSLLGRNQRCLEDLKNYLVEESKDKKKQPFSFDGWEFNLRTVRLV